MRRIKASNLNRGLVGAWCPSVAGNGLLLPDLSGYGNHGTLTNMDASDWVGTDRGRALDFDGVDDYVGFANFNSAFTTEASLVSWVKLNLATPTLTTNTGFFQTTSPLIAAASHYPWVDGLAYLATFRDSRVNNISLSANIVRTNWHMVTITTNTANWRLYQNDTQVHSVAGQPVITFDTSIFTIARTANTTTFFFLQGQLNDIRIYNRVLSPSEIKQLYEGGPGYGLRLERKRTRFQVQGFNAGRFRRQQLIGTGVY